MQTENTEAVLQDDNFVSCVLQHDPTFNMMHPWVKSAESAHSTAQLSINVALPCIPQTPVSLQHNFYP